MGNAFQDKYLALINQSPYIQSIARPGQQIIAVEYYCYNGQVGSVAVPLAVGVPQSTVIETQSDSDFAVTFISTSVQEIAGANVAYNDNVAMQILDNASGKLFFNIATVAPLVSGAGGFPFVLPAPRVIAPNTNLTITATNRDTVVNGGAGPVGLLFALHGTRIYYAS
jgi:hypothetical protein